MIRHTTTPYFLNASVNITLIYYLRIATPFVKEQTSASAWLLSRDTSVTVFNKLPQVGELLGDRVEDTANERIMAIVGGFTTIKGNYLYITGIPYPIKTT